MQARRLAMIRRTCIVLSCSLLAWAGYSLKTYKPQKDDAAGNPAPSMTTASLQKTP